MQAVEVNLKIIETIIIKVRKINSVLLCESPQNHPKRRIALIAFLRKRTESGFQCFFLKSTKHDALKAFSLCTYIPI